MRPRQGGVRATWMTAAGVAVLTLMVGCGAGEFDMAEPAADAPPAGAADGARERPADMDSVDSGVHDGQAGGSLTERRNIIYTGEITVRVVQVDSAAREVTALAHRHDGFVAGDRRTAGEHRRATLVLRIPSDRFPTAVDEIADIGTEEARDLDTEDVTEEMVDLDTRIATAQASVDRTRQLLERADSISDIVAVEAELAEREARLASLQARQRQLVDRTSLSTITVSLIGPEEVIEENGDDSALGFLTGLSAGWHAFTRSMTVLVTVFGALLPWLVAVGVPAAVGVWWARRRRATPPPLEQGAPPTA
jgi:hypothetical protein